MCTGPVPPRRPGPSCGRFDDAPFSAQVRRRRLPVRQVRGDQVRAHRHQPSALEGELRRPASPACRPQHDEQATGGAAHARAPPRRVRERLRSGHRRGPARTAFGWLTPSLCPSAGGARRRGRALALALVPRPALTHSPPQLRRARPTPPSASIRASALRGPALPSSCSISSAAPSAALSETRQPLPQAPC